MPSTTTRSPAFTPLEDLDPAGRRAPIFTGTCSTLSPATRIQEGLLAQLLQRQLRHLQRLARILLSCDLQQHARAQPALRIVELGARGERARGGVDARADRGDAAFEDFAGKASLVARTSAADRERAQAALGHGEIELDLDTSSSVVITVPGVTSEPGLTWRRPSTPAKGATIDAVADGRLLRFQRARARRRARRAARRAAWRRRAASAPAACMRS
jgi:hypothetical protein